jgi:WD40 repeat protein
MAWTSDGRYLLAGGDSGVLSLMPHRYDATRKTLRCHERPIIDIAVHPDGKRAMTVGLEGRARVWNIQIGQGALHQLDSGPDAAVAFGADSRWYVGYGGELYETATARPVGRAVGPEYLFAPLVVSADGSVLAAGIGVNRIGVWTRESARERLRILRSSATSRAATAPRATTKPADRTLRPRPAILVDVGETTALALSPNGNLLAYGRWEGTVGLWDLPARRPGRTLGRMKMRVSSVAFSPDGRRVLATCMDHRSLQANPARDTVGLWDVTGKPVPWPPTPGGTCSAAFSPDGEWLVTGSRRGGRIVVRDAVTSAHVRTLDGHTSRVAAMAFLPRSGRMITAGSDKTIKLWDTRTWQEVLSHRAGAQVGQLAVSPDGNTFVAVLDRAPFVGIFSARRPESATPLRKPPWSVHGPPAPPRPKAVPKPKTLSDWIRRGLRFLCRLKEKAAPRR